MFSQYSLIFTFAIHLCTCTSANQFLIFIEVNLIKHVQQLRNNYIANFYDHLLIRVCYDEVQRRLTQEQYWQV